jgi:predicted secreted protein
MSKQQTAVDWLVQQLKTIYDIDIERLSVTDKAKQMEKEQIKAAYNQGYRDGEIDNLYWKDGDVQSFNDAENYYTETYVR